MALTNYNDLLVSVPKWLNKRNLDGMAGDFITLTETDLRSKLRTREMQTTVDAPVSCAAVNLPLDWLDATRLWMDGASRALDFCTPDELVEIRARARAVPGCAPTHFTWTDSAIELAPAPSGEPLLHMTYYRKIPRLTVAEPTNWLTTRDIGVYLYGALVRASPYLMDDTRVATWSKEYGDRVGALNLSSQVSLHSGAPLKRRIRGYGGGVNPKPWSASAGGRYP
jgi:hypothetical protein